MPRQLFRKGSIHCIGQLAGVGDGNHFSCLQPCGQGIVLIWDFKAQKLGGIGIAVIFGNPAATPAFRKVANHTGIPSQPYFHNFPHSGAKDGFKVKGIAQGLDDPIESLLTQ